MGGFEVVDARYAPLYERALAALRDDERVASVAVSGSIGSGTADRWSDLDLEIVVRAEHHAAFLEDWPSWLAAITPTVFARTPIAPFIINAVTDDGLTLDVAVYAGERPNFSRPDPPPYVVGLLVTRPFTSVADALEYAVAEQLRGFAGPYISLLQRDEHMRALTGVPHLLGLLNTVFLAETGAPPPGKHWNRSFTDEQRAAVAALPPVRATRAATIAFGLGIGELMVTRARPLYPRYGLAWPGDLAAVVAARLRAVLEIDVSRWLY
ncbi:MAG: nucleotidyltransferase domain-containing protein [Acidimicrobiia bacterium]